MSQWQLGIPTNLGTFYTVAGSSALFEAPGAAWCGHGCGKCFKLTSGGIAPAGQGTGAPVGDSIFVALTNLCPYKGNERVRRFETKCNLKLTKTVVSYNRREELVRFLVPL